MYILMWCLFFVFVFFFFFLPFHTHFLPFAPPLPPFSVPAIVAPYFQPRGGQANRQLSPELIANLFCRSSIGMHMSGMIGMFHPQDYQAHHLCSKFSLRGQGCMYPFPSSGLSVGSLGDTTILQGFPGSILLLSSPSTKIHILIKCI